MDDLKGGWVEILCRDCEELKPPPDKMFCLDKKFIFNLQLPWCIYSNGLNGMVEMVRKKIPEIVRINKIGNSSNFLVLLDHGYEKNPA